MTKVQQPSGAGCLVLARHVGSEGQPLASELAYLFLPVGRFIRRGILRRCWPTPVQMIFCNEDAHVIFDDQMLDEFVENRRVLLGEDGYWEIVVAPEGSLADLSVDFRASMDIDKQLSLNGFIEAMVKWRMYDL